MKQQEKLKALFISPSDWSLIALLSTLLKPFHDATVQLQSQKYPMIVSSKVIEKSLAGFYSSKSSNTNFKTNERIICTAIYEKIKIYFFNNISKAQEKVTAVNILSLIFVYPIFICLFNSS